MLDAIYETRIGQDAAEFEEIAEYLQFSSTLAMGQLLTVTIPFPRKGHLPDLEHFL